MNEIFKDITGVAMAIVGLALLYTLVNRNNNTSQVVTSSAQGFASVLTAAMGGGSGSGTAFGMN